MEPQKNLEIPRVFEAQSQPTNNPHEVGNFGFEQNINRIDSDKARAEAMQAFSNQDSQQPISQAILPAVQESSANSPVAVVPATARDIDLMEDEWVKDLKKMIVETKGDPYAREVRFKEMQIDYLKKRYNRIINGGK
ncbi:MAG: hypothetical protein HXL38_000545 [Candidatus Saccharimonas sp.]|jgi:hypothetical protein cdiviTM7_01500|nr:MAG: hypothetical protein HXL38_000545 [Candidatus Saccharimonas sp.]RKW00717.1 MAG: hypothetical protein D8B37_02755 [Candidatus Saccharimonas sp.]